MSSLIYPEYYFKLFSVSQSISVGFYDLVFKSVFIKET